jgi:5-methylthioribose kinase
VDIERPGELERYLRARRWIRASERVRVAVLGGGVSNRTVRVERDSGEDWVVKQALPRLRVDVEWFSDPRRTHREAMAMRWLIHLVPSGSVPRLVFEDEECHLVAMTAVPHPHTNWKSELLSGKVDMDRVREFGRLLAGIHRLARDHARELGTEFGDRSWFHGLRVEPYYLFTASVVGEAAGFLGRLAAEAGRPAWTLVHGDYSPKNILVHAGRMVLIDHEVVHWGDGAFDLGFSLAHLLSKAHHLTEHRPSLLEAARLYWSTYRSALGEAGDPGLETRAVRHAVGCLLARVAGRSKLEYLDRSERSRQREVVVALMGALPDTVDALVDRFAELLGG